MFYAFSYAINLEKNGFFVQSSMILYCLGHLTEALKLLTSHHLFVYAAIWGRSMYLFSLLLLLFRLSSSDPLLKDIYLSWAKYLERSSLLSAARIYLVLNMEEEALLCIIRLLETIKQNAKEESTDKIKPNDDAKVRADQCSQENLFHLGMQLAEKNHSVLLETLHQLQ